MGKRDFRHHEAKKPKKSARKATIADILPPPVTVEVIKKKHRQEPEVEA